MNKIMKKVKDSWQYLSLIVTIGLVFIGFYNWFNDLTEISTTNRRLSLKNNIWNRDIPIQEKLASCDEYIKLGYNSYTKAHCDDLVEEYRYNEKK